jgi:dsDNA-specific endonuclease/ATPase MutS2
MPDPHHVPIDGTLDLHTFRPSEIGDLIPEFLRECQLQGFATVRIIHGKGTGALRKGVHAVLGRDPRVERFTLCEGLEGGWGATRVWLRPTNREGNAS